MFNMESTFENKKSSSDFDLESEMRDPVKSQVIKRSVDEKIRILNASLREGQEKECFEKKQVLLNGYLALQRVLSRINQRFV